jgi:hypothetical protein
MRRKLRFASFLIALEVIATFVARRRGYSVGGESVVRRHRVAVELLGGRIRPGSEEPAALSQCRVVEEKGDAIVENDDAAVGADEDVGRLQIAVHDPSLVECAESGGDLRSDPASLIG